ncbi:MAG TPA: hypothetical protein VFS30_10895 [Dehalococcoidia bacterium]|nr:hypothetical protein [Dehalococcoidia bacterium]
MLKTLPLICLTLLALGLTACSGGDDDGGGSNALDIFFAPENADALAHASLPEAADLPGGGWEVTARDDFSDGGDDGFDFETFAASEPACSQLSALANVGGIFGSGDDDDLPAGRAKVEFEKAQADALLPNGIEVEVEIEETVSEVEGAWTLIKNLFESDETQTCMLAVFNQVFGELAADGDIKVDVAAAEASSEAPNNGATLAFDIHMDISGIELDMALEMYLWPYGNAKVTVQFMGTPDTLDSDVTGPALDAVVEKLKAAAGSEG